MSVIQLQRLARSLTLAMASGPRFDDAHLWVTMGPRLIQGCALSDLQRGGPWGGSWGATFAGQVLAGDATLIAHGYLSGDEEGYFRGNGFRMWVPSEDHLLLLSAVPESIAARMLEPGGSLEAVLDPEYLESLRATPYSKPKSFEVHLVGPPAL